MHHLCALTAILVSSPGAFSQDKPAQPAPQKEQALSVFDRSGKGTVGKSSATFFFYLKEVSTKNFDAALKALSALEQLRPFTKEEIKKAKLDGLAGGFWGFLSLYSRDGNWQILLRRDEIFSEKGRVDTILEPINK